MNTLRVKKVAEKTGISVPMIWAWSRTGQYNFPKPFKLSDQITVWDEEDINKWLLTRKQAAQEETHHETQ